MDALDRGIELSKLPINEVPPLARLYLENLSRRVGICGEVCLTAYVLYAQLTEGLKCNHPAYIPAESERAIYNNLLELFKKNGEGALTWTR